MKACTRRQFLKKTAGAGAAAFVLPRFAIGTPRPSPNGRLDVAFVGSGGIANAAYNGCKTENIVALADIDESMFYKDGTLRAPKARRFTDFRKMFDTMGDDIDMVCVNTPDHTHFPATMEALQRGIPVFTQKPLTHNIWEARTLARAAEQRGIPTVMGNQGHTTDGIREFKEWCDAGIFGKVTEVHSAFPGPQWNSPWFKLPQIFPPPPMPVPDKIDWDLWLGPVPPVEYHSSYHPKGWRGFWPFGTGMLGDWFCHTCDGPVWALDLYEPTTVELEKIDNPRAGMIPDGTVVRWDFPARGSMPPCVLRWHDGNNRMRVPDDWSWGKPPINGSILFGSENTGYLDQRSNNPRLTSREKTRELKESGGLPNPTYPRVDGSPFQELIRAVKGEGPEPGSNFSYGAKLTEIALLGVLAQRFGGRIEWDTEKMRVTNRPELNHYVKDPVRKGWEYGEEVWKS